MAGAVVGDNSILESQSDVSDVTAPRGDRFIEVHRSFYGCWNRGGIYLASREIALPEIPRNSARSTPPTEPLKAIPRPTAVMELRRTVPVKLAVEDAQAAVLHETIEQFLWAANHVVDRARQDDGYVLTDSGTLHERTYETVRDNTELHANHVQAARRRANNAAKTIAFDLLRDQNGAEGGALVGVRTNGGTMTASGELLAHPAMG